MTAATLTRNCRNITGRSYKVFCASILRDAIRAGVARHNPDLLESSHIDRETERAVARVCRYVDYWGSRERKKKETIGVVELTRRYMDALDIVASTYQHRRRSEQRLQRYLSLFLADRINARGVNTSDPDALAVFADALEETGHRGNLLPVVRYQARQLYRAQAKRAKRAKGGSR